MHLYIRTVIFGITNILGTVPRPRTGVRATKSTLALGEGPQNAVRSNSLLRQSREIRNPAGFYFESTKSEIPRDFDPLSRQNYVSLPTGLLKANHPRQSESLPPSSNKTQSLANTSCGFILTRLLVLFSHVCYHTHTHTHTPRLART